MNRRRSRWAALITAALLVMQATLAQNDPFVDMLNNRGYDRDAILQGYETADDIGEAEKTTSQDHTARGDTDMSDGDDDATLPTEDKPVAPGFRLIEPTRREGAVVNNSELTALALVLPIDASGLTAAAARRFHEGCVQGLRGGGAALRVDVYVSDGSAASATAAYQQAVADGAGFVIGPIQKKSVAALLAAQAQAPVPTLLLQPGNGDNYYVLTIDVAEELGELARFLQAGEDNSVLLVSDQSANSRRQTSAFNNAWTGAGEVSNFYVYEPEKDWQRLFARLKQEIEQTEKQQNDKPSQTIIVAAGNADFARKVRSFSPQEYTVFAASAFFAGEQGVGAAFLENLHILEMPWFIAAGSAADFETPLIRTQPILQQRFYALGVDACRIAQLSFLWVDGWRFDGVSGGLQLQQNVFRRRGLPAQYQGGYLRPLATQ